MIRRGDHRRTRVAADVAAYPRGQSECHAIRTAYRVWVAASAVCEPLTVKAYQSALDREAKYAHQAHQARAVDIHFVPAFQAPGSRLTLGDAGTLAPRITD